MGFPIYRFFGLRYHVFSGRPPVLAVTKFGISEKEGSYETKRPNFACRLRVGSNGSRRL